jgi:NAD(P)-dependent dehydrogenase (short-subunit alcohol dehydrogenase family)
MARTNNDPVIVVTGGNRGIGFEICRQLVARGVQVVLTARKRAAGEAAVKKLAGGKHAAAFHPLNVTTSASAPSLLSCQAASRPPAAAS